MPSAVSDPSVHIIIPLFNSGATVERTLRSLGVIPPEQRSRTHVFIVDDGSTDGSVDKAKAVLQELAWPAVTIRSKPNGGSGSARNVALRELTGGWVLFLDADDELTADPVSLSEQASDASCILCSVTLAHAGRADRIIPPATPQPGRLEEQFSAGNPYLGPAVFFRRELLTTLFDESLRYLEDWHFWAANPRLFSHARVLPEITLARVHASAGSKTSHQAMNGDYRIRVADRLGQLWSASPSAVIRNNLALQKAIGAVQQGSARDLRSLVRWPVTPALYAKALVYLFAYKAYLRLYPYA